MQLEDDVISKPGYVGEIKSHLLALQEEHPEWLITRYCRLGFIGQLFRTKHLAQFALYLLSFHSDQPSDWLLDNWIEDRVCRKDKDSKDCLKRKNAVWRTYENSLFQHIGYHSSLDGKVQKLKDKKFKSKELQYFPHSDNPRAAATTTLKIYKEHTIEKAYKGKRNKRKPKK